MIRAAACHSASGGPYFQGLCCADTRSRYQTRGIHPLLTIQKGSRYRSYTYNHTLRARQIRTLRQCCLLVRHLPYLTTCAVLDTSLTFDKVVSQNSNVPSPTFFSFSNKTNGDCWRTLVFRRTNQPTNREAVLALSFLPSLIFSPRRILNRIPSLHDRDLYK